MCHVLGVVLSLFVSQVLQNGAVAAEADEEPIDVVKNASSAEVRGQTCTLTVSFLAHLADAILFLDISDEHFRRTAENVVSLLRFSLPFISSSPFTLTGSIRFRDGHLLNL